MIVDDEGFVARVDFLWSDFGIVGEADGAGKYINRGALVAEKLREDRLRRLGYLMVRWTWDELIHTPWVIRARLEAALARAA